MKPEPQPIEPPLALVRQAVTVHVLIHDADDLGGVCARGDVDDSAVVHAEAVDSELDRERARNEADLRREIAELRRQVAAKAAVKVETFSAKADAKVTKVEIPILKPREVARLEKALERGEGITHRLNNSLQVVVSELGSVATALRMAKVKPVETARPAIPAREAIPVRSRVQEGMKDGPRLGPGERATLTAIAQQPGTARDQLTVLTGYRRSSRDAYLQRLGAAGLIERNGQGFEVTDAGLRFLGSNFQSLPTGSALGAYWLARLTGGEREVLRLVMEAHPRAMERDSISEKLGYARSSRDAYLQRLKARRLVVVAGGQARAAEALFD